MQGPFYIVNLYSGRRREGDFHAHMQPFLNNATFPAARHILVISLDTAIHDGMNVHQERVWKFLMDAARSGRLLGLLLGPPCETWSCARHETQYDEDGIALCGPRPLRDAENCWGIDMLSFK